MPGDDTFFERAFAPDGGALVFLDDRDPRRVERALSRTQLRDGVIEAARLLAAEGVVPGDGVILCLPTGFDFVRFFLGVQWLGAVPIPLPVPVVVRGRPHGEERVLGVVGSSGARWVVGDQRLSKVLGKHREGPTLIEPTGQPTGAEPPLVPQRAEAPAFIQYTAGSTGDPKGVVVTHGNVRANLEAIGQAVAVSREDRVLSWLPLFHDMGLVGTLLFPLFHGLATYLFSPLGFALRPAGWLEAISTHRATLSAGPHFAYSLCARKVDPARLRSVDLSSWRLALDGAEPIHAGTVRAFIERFAPLGFRAEAYLPVYGMSEATLAVSFPDRALPPRIDRVIRAGLARRRAAPAGEGDDAAELVSVGRALPGMTLTIRDPKTKETLGERAVGEIVVSGGSVSPGYLGRTRPPRSELETGDLGYLADGELFIAGRIKDLIIHAGANVYPSDLEEAVATVEGVRKGRVVAFGVASESEGTDRVIIAAEVKTARHRAELERQIRRALRERFGFEPADVRLVARHTLPLTTSGKLMRTRAKKAYLARQL